MSIAPMGGDWFGQQGIQGYQPAATSSMQQDTNAAGAGADPFGYTGGSLLTPWTEKFQGPKGTPGGYHPPKLDKFNFGQFNYNPVNVGQFNQQAPTAQKYGDFQAPDPNALPDSKAYQFRLKQGQQALQNSAAARGTLLTGATAKALQDYGQDAASQEYDKEYNRALTTYGTNRDTSQQFFGNQMASFGGNLNAFQANTGATLGAGSLNLQGQQGAYDRNYGLARTQWQDAADQANARAAAGSANSAADYNRAMNEYKLNYDIFQNNQQNQFNRLSWLSDNDYRNASLGMQIAGQNGQSLGSIYTGNANAQGAAQIAQGNAAAAGATNVGNAVGNYYYATHPYGSN